MLEMLSVHFLPFSDCITHERKKNASLTILYHTSDSWEMGMEMRLNWCTLMAYTHRSVLASFPGPTQLSITISTEKWERAWYLFSCEHDIIGKW